ncbi:hypothetical protein OKN36_20920 [Furfurilactobacillus sp. OKN36]
MDTNSATSAKIATIVILLLFVITIVLGFLTPLAKQHQVSVLLIGTSVIFIVSNDCVLLRVFRKKKQTIDKIMRNGHDNNLKY